MLSTAELEEIDFADMARMRDEIDALARSGSIPAVAPHVTEVEEQFTGFFTHLNVTRTISPPNAASVDHSPPVQQVVNIAHTSPLPASPVTEYAIGPDNHPTSLSTDPPNLVKTQNAPTSLVLHSPKNVPTAICHTDVTTPHGLQDTETDPEAVVYVPLRPVTSNPSPAQQDGAPALATSVPAAPGFKSVLFSFADRPFAEKQPRHAPKSSLRRKAKAKSTVQRKEARSARKRIECQKIGERFAAIMHPEHAHEDQRDDPRWEERRRGDSDLDWGEERTDDEASSGMELDPELSIDLQAMKTFVRGMSSGFVTMDDIADEERIARENEENETTGSSSDDDLNDVVDTEELKLIAEPRDALDCENASNGYDESSGDEGESPRSSFQARLRRLREQTPWKPGRAILDSTSDEDDDFPNFTSNRGRKKDEYIFPHLHLQWNKDRAKKTEHKRSRARARLELAADPFATKMSGKKGHKAMLAAIAAGTSNSDCFVDMADLFGDIRTFAANVGGPWAMALPPMDNFRRKAVHQLANALNLKSKSKGEGRARYTTLYKTSRTGCRVAEEKVPHIFRRSRKLVMPKQREGDEVGKVR